MPKHGQILLVRPLAQADLADLRRMTGSPDMACPDAGLMARLVGEPAGFVAFTALPPDLRIDQVFVAPAWRGKRIGRGLILELERAARRLDCTALLIGHDCDAREFFLHVGFVDSGSLLVKKLPAGC